MARILVPFDIDDPILIIYSNSADQSMPYKLNSQRSINSVDISTNNSFTGGTFSLYVETSSNSGFKAIFADIENNIDVSTIDATLIGSSVPDGLASGWSFDGAPFRLKLVGSSLVAADSQAIYVNIQQEQWVI